MDPAVLKSKLGVTEDDLSLLRRRGVKSAAIELIRGGRFTREQASAALSESYGFERYDLPGRISPPLAACV